MTIKRAGENASPVSPRAIRLSTAALVVAVLVFVVGASVVLLGMVRAANATGWELSIAATAIEAWMTMPCMVLGAFLASYGVFGSIAAYCIRQALTDPA